MTLNILIRISIFLPAKMKLEGGGWIEEKRKIKITFYKMVFS